MLDRYGDTETDGHGTLIAHESSWVNPNRNTGSRAEVERLLLDAVGADKMIWAPGIAGADITDYHIDALARQDRQRLSGASHGGDHGAAGIVADDPTVSIWLNFR